MLKYQKTCQIILLILGVSMISYGAVRGEAATVLGLSLIHILKEGKNLADGVITPIARFLLLESMW